MVETLIHTVLLPGTIAVAMPYWLLGSSRDPRSLGAGAFGLAGLLPLLAGVAILAWCTWDFIFSGRGTPNPLDPPKFLVARGAYRYARNPMYIGVGLILIGEALIFDSLILLEYSAVVMFGFHLFVVLYEEPFLRGRFGAAYEEFCGKVPRWIVRRPA